MDEIRDNGDKIRKVLFNEVSLAFAIGGVMLSGFLYLTSPQRESDLAIKLLQAQVDTQTATIATVTKTQQNDTQEVRLELTNTRNEVQELTKQVVKLQTIIEERIPARK